MQCKEKLPLSDNCNCCICLFIFISSLISWFLCGRKQSVALRVVIIGVIKNNVWFNPVLNCMTQTVTSAFSALKIKHAVIDEENL